MRFQFLHAIGQMLTAKLLKMQNLEDEEELAYSPGLSRLVKLLYTVYTHIIQYI